MNRVRSRILVGLAALGLAGGLVVAVGTASKAASPECGSACISLASQEWGTGYVSAVKNGASQTGQPILISAAGPDTSEDFQLLNEGTVLNACTIDAGLLPSQVCDTWPNNELFEYQYNPGGVPSGLCLGTAATAANGTEVSLQPCGVIATTLWIPLTIDTISGVEPLIAGTDVEVNTPYVLTAPGTVGDHLTTHKLDLVDGTFNPAQMWQVLTGVL